MRDQVGDAEVIEALCKLYSTEEDINGGDLVEALYYLTTGEPLDRFMTLAILDEMTP